MKKFHLHLRRYAASLVGIVFLISGILKIWDPVGTMLIVTEYFKFLGMPGLIPVAKGVGIAVAFLECTVGIGLITGVLRKVSAIAAYSLVGIFTILTLLLWIFNAPMDCGCFGQAFHLTHAQSFLKNVILLALCVAAFVPFREFGVAKTHRGVAASLAMISIIAATIYSNSHLPIVDFTAFNWGSQLSTALNDEDSEADPHDAAILSFRDADGNYCDELAASERVIIFSVYDTENADWARLEEQYRAAAATEALPLVLVASAENIQLPPDILPYFCDYKTLITMNRSNGGGTYFYYGELIHKWSAQHFPSKLSEDVADDPIALSTRHVTRRRITAQGFCVILAAILMLV
ncbi:MAG: hypothetical protein IK008_03740 [Bacteroidales bacterium]|nr:hypothetical protein [Bacteroidales bacterium]